jgi:hypothetical protein
MRIAHSSWRGRLLPAPNVQSRLAESMAADWKLLCVHGRTDVRSFACSLAASVCWFSGWRALRFHPGQRALRFIQPFALADLITPHTHIL